MRWTERPFLSINKTNPGAQMGFEKLNCKSQLKILFFFFWFFKMSLEHKIKKNTKTIKNALSLVCVGGKDTKLNFSQ